MLQDARQELAWGLSSGLSRLTCGGALAAGLCGGRAPVLQAKPHALANAALQGNGSLERLPEQTQQPLQSILESPPGVVGGTAQCQLRPAPPDPHASGVVVIKALFWRPCQLASSGEVPK